MPLFKGRKVHPGGDSDGPWPTPPGTPLGAKRSTETPLGGQREADAAATASNPGEEAGVADAALLDKGEIRRRLAGAMGLDPVSSEEEEEEVWTTDDESWLPDASAVASGPASHAVDSIATPLPVPDGGNVAVADTPTAWAGSSHPLLAEDPQGQGDPSAEGPHYDLANHPDSARDTVIYATPGTTARPPSGPGDIAATGEEGPLTPPRPSIHRGPVRAGEDAGTSSHHHYEIPGAVQRTPKVDSSLDPKAVTETVITLEREQSEANHLKLTIQDMTVRTLQTSFRVHLFIMASAVAVVPVACLPLLSGRATLFAYCVGTCEALAVVVLVCSVILYRRMLSRQFWDQKFGYWLSHKDVRNYHFFTSLGQASSNLMLLLVLLGDSFVPDLLWAAAWVVASVYLLLYGYGHRKESKGSVSPYWLWAICTLEIAILAGNILWLIYADSGDVTRVGVAVFARNVAATLGTIGMVTAVRPQY